MEGYVLYLVDAITKLLANQNLEVREGILEFLCYISDLKISTKILLVKQSKLIARIVSLLSSGQSKVPGDRQSDKNAKMAALTLNNLCQA